MITIFIKTYNSEIILPFCIKFYRDRFNNCKIIIYDNESYDSTVEIAKKYGCEVREYATNGMIDLYAGNKIKNNCWKNADTEWALVCDADEMLDINQSQLQQESKSGVTIISTEGYNMVNNQDNLDIDSICHGFRDEIFDKSLLFNRQKIYEINYGFGSHCANPSGDVKYSTHRYRIYHYHFLNPEHIASKYKEAASRLNAECIQKGWCYHYLKNDDTEVRELFNKIRSSSIKLF